MIIFLELYFFLWLAREKKSLVNDDSLNEVVFFTL